MRRYGLPSAVMLATCLVGWAGLADENIEPKQFKVRMKLTEEGAAHPLASPVLMVLADTPASVDMRGNRDFHGRTLPFGFVWNLTVHSLDDKHVMLDGDLERSDASNPSDEIVYRTINSLHFHCRVELGKAHEIKLIGPGGAPQVLSMRADACDELAPETGE